MEKLLQIVVTTLFGASAISFIAGMVSWISASFCLTPKARERFSWNPMNGTLDANNLTARGIQLRRIAIRLMLAWIILGIVSVFGGGLLLALCR